MADTTDADPDDSTVVLPPAASDTDLNITWGCAVCRAPLAVMDFVEDGIPRHRLARHTLNSTARHRPVPVPASADDLDAATMVCDFCGHPEPVWSYPTAGSTADAAIGGFVVTKRSDQAWVACAPCADLIEADNHHGLMRRTFTRSAVAAEIRNVTADLTSEDAVHFKARAWSMLNENLDQFWSARTAEPRLLLTQAPGTP